MGAASGKPACLSLTGAWNEGKESLWLDTGWRDSGSIYREGVGAGGGRRSMGTAGKQPGPHAHGQAGRQAGRGAFRRMWLRARAFLAVLRHRGNGAGEQRQGAERGREARDGETRGERG